MEPAKQSIKSPHSSRWRPAARVVPLSTLSSDRSGQLRTLK